MVNRAVTGRVYIGIGSNLGDRLENIMKAVGLVEGYMKITARSGIYETEPVGGIMQDMFLNCVIEVLTDIPPYELFDLLKLTEKELGRVKEVKWGPRLIDLDILTYNDEVVEEKNLTVPHREMHKRRFALIPLQEIAPDFIHPVLKKKIPEMLKDIKESRVELFKDSGS